MLFSKRFAIVHRLQPLFCALTEMMAVIASSSLLHAVAV
jgi:hypothetical protein